LENKSPYKKGGMFEGANPVVFNYAKNLRKTMTTEEMILWGHLKNGIKEYKFRRQHPISNYIADIYCHKLKLLIEVDGTIHNNPEVKINNLKRESELATMGYTNIRFTNDEVLNNLQSILEKINTLVDNNIRDHTNNKK